MKKTKKTSYKSKSLFAKLFNPMLIITMLQIFALIASMVIGGEFSYIRKFSYNAFIEKCANRKGFVENMMNSKTETVYNTSTQISGLVDSILKEKNCTADDIKKDKELNKEIISGSSEILVSLLRQNQVNDVYMILETGDLYQTSDDLEKKAGIYIRDLDPYQNEVGNNNDLLLEMGNSDIANSLGITLDYEWAACLEIPEAEREKFGFYCNTIETAKSKSHSDLFELGCWTGFSNISKSSTESIKYTLPLTTKDGEIFGVIGIGITEKMVQSLMPMNDYFNGKACYMLAVDYENNGEYEILMHTGAIYERIVNSDTVFDRSHKIDNNIYDFNYNNKKIDSIGTIQEMNIYNSASPYKTQNWAIIGIGDKDGVMAVYYSLIKMLMVSSAVSILVCIVGAVFIIKRVTKPVINMTSVLTAKGAAKKDIAFVPSTIREIDALGESIKQLQINVRENSSRVSQIISMIDLGIGVFMYDYAEGDVFIGKSLIKLLEFDSLDHDKDTIISFSHFRELLSKTDRQNKICSDKIFIYDKNGEPARKNIEITYKKTSGINTYLRFSLYRDNSSVICLVQDITDNVIEKNRIEFERDYDVTTGLLNRRAYLAKLDELFSKPQKLKVAAVVMIDLDNLKFVNDTYGHDFGDDYLRAAASVLKTMVEYNAVTARLSGDEFNIFFSGFNSKEEIRRIIKKLQERINENYCVLSDGSKYYLKASGGVAWYPDNSQKYNELMKFADFAMYSVKHSTKGTIAEFDGEQYLKDNVLMTSIREMNNIIEKKLVRFAFQPVISVKTARVYGYEILMRPQSDILKTPLDLIRIAKTASKIYELEKLTWMKGLSEFKEKIEEGVIKKGSKIFINSVSECILSNRDAGYVKQIYGELLPDVVLEIPKSERDNDNYINDKIKLMEQWSADIALDNFVSDYNSEMLIVKTKPYIIKIDHSIISACDKDQGKINLINNIIKMARSCNVMVAAEGIETAGELQTVIKCGVDFVQGYYIEHPLIDPVPPDERVMEEIREAYKLAPQSSSIPPRL